MTIETVRRASLEFVCIFGHDDVGGISSLTERGEPYGDLTGQLTLIANKRHRV